MLKVLILVSGGGTNLQAIIDRVQDGTITNTEIIGDISEDYTQEIINLGFKTGFIFLKKLIDNKTGEIFYTTSNLTCTQ